MSPESPQRYQWDTLSAPTTQKLLAGDFSNAAQQEVQREINAYFHIDPTKFMGILYHADGRGPEKPYFRPEGTDWKPEIQAISRIGVQYEYWEMVQEALANRRIAASELFLADLIILYPTDNGKTLLETGSAPASVQYAATEVGDTTPQFPRYVVFINYGGDGDFYGVYKNTIFPMDVKTSSSKEYAVKAKALGLKGDMVERTWQSWHTIDKVRGEIYHQTFLQYYKQLPYTFVQLFDNLLSIGVKIKTFTQLADSLRGRDQALEAFDTLTKSIETHLRSEEPKPELLEATKLHAENLKALYTTAKQHCRDIYPY